MVTFASAADAAAAYGFQHRAQTRGPAADAARAVHAGRGAVVGSCPYIIMPGHVEDVQSRVRQQRDQIDGALGVCLTSGKITMLDPLWLQWRPMQERIKAFLAYKPTWMPPEGFDLAAKCLEGDNIERDLVPWFEKIKQLGCSPLVQPTPQKNPMGELLGDFAPWIILLILALKATNQT